MKKTEEDRQFAADFAAALQPHIDRELAAGKSFAQIAGGLGVTDWGLKKQLGGGTPSIRTVALAFARYRVSVSYARIDLGKALSVARRKKRTVSETQLLLPFQITAAMQIRDMILKRDPKGVRQYRIQLSMRIVS